MDGLRQKIAAFILGVLIVLLVGEGMLRVVGLFYSGGHPDAQCRRRGSDNSEFVIVCLGDSNTYGFGAAYEQTYPRQLEKLLEATFSRKIRVINEGVPSYNTTNILESLPDVLKKTKPDLIILWAGGANFWNYWGYENYKSNKTAKARFFKFLYRIRLVKLFKAICSRIEENAAEDAASAIPGQLSEGDEARKVAEFDFERMFNVAEPNYISKELIEQEINMQGLEGEKYKLIAQASLRQGKFAEALQWFGRDIQDAATNKEDSYFSMAEAYKNLNKNELAKEYLKRLICSGPLSNEAYQRIIDMYMEISGKTFEGAGEWVYGNLNAAEKDTDWFLKIGRHYDLLGAFDWARRCYLEAFNRGKSAGGKTCILIGKTFFKENNFMNALGWFEKAVIENPEDGEGYYLSGLCYLNGMHNSAKAKEYFARGIMADPGFDANYLNLAYIYNGREDYYNAIEYAFKAIQINPKNSDACRELGIALSHLQFYDESVKYFHRCIALNPIDYDAYYRLGVVYYEMGADDLALSWLKKGICRNPYYDGNYIVMAGIYADHKHEYATAVEYFKKALQCNPLNEHTYDQIKRVAVLADKVDEVREFLSRDIPENRWRNSTILALQDKDAYIDRAVEWISHDIKKIKEIADREKIPMIMLNYHNRWETRYTDCLYKIAAEYDTPLVDLLPKFDALGERQDQYLIPDNHPNARGYAIVANAVLDKIIQLKIITDKKAKTSQGDSI
ncbi:MAG: tetratricopeptide repeat protein [Candidatus Omnitrophica bacterium]|nr:tetratricopeptide repeat protein [Candidatus Omnitrophota bacterium]MBU1924477.1 tetratricopeptide repeat protein [Candidatus Omnitrophota bacterium]